MDSSGISANREKIVLERILTVKQLIRDGRGGPVELHELGVLYHNLQNYERAAEFLSQLLAEYPDYVELGAVHALRILCLIRKGDFQNADKHLSERLRIHPNDTRLLGMHAYVCEKTRRADEAIEAHRRVLNTEPENLNSLNSLGYLLTLRGREGDQREAYECLKKAVAGSPDNPAYLDSFGVFLSKKGQSESARKALMKALRRAPDNAEILEHLKQLLGVE